MMPTPTLLLDLELQLWILTAPGSHSTSSGQGKERAGRTQHQDVTGQWYLTYHLPVGNTFPFTKVIWINGCLDGGAHPSPLGSTQRAHAEWAQWLWPLPMHTALYRGMPAQPRVLSFGGLHSSDLCSISAQHKFTHTCTFYIHRSRNLLFP